MYALPSIVWAFGLLSLVSRLAASDPCTRPSSERGPLVYITTQADVDLIIDCLSIDYTIAINSNCTIEGILTLPNLVSLYALDTICDTALTGFSFPQLTTITEDIFLFSDNITSLNFPLLSQVGGSIDLDLPALRSWTGTDSLQSVNFIMLDHHNITSLSFRNLSVQLEMYFNFTSPGASLYLNGTATPGVTVTGYNDTTFIADFENAGKMRISGCNNITINTKSALALEISSNPNLISFEASNLASLGAVSYESGRLHADQPVALLIANNSQQAVIFPFLTTINGGLSMMNNDALTSPISYAFSLLESVTNTITLSGALGPVYFPDLTFVGGNINITSTSTDTSCTNLTPLIDNGNLKGNFSCHTPKENITWTQPTPTLTPTSSSHRSKLDTHAMIGISFGVIIFGFCVSSLLVLWILKRRGWVSGA